MLLMLVLFSIDDRYENRKVVSNQNVVPGPAVDVVIIYEQIMQVWIGDVLRGWRDLFGVTDDRIRHQFEKNIGVCRRSNSVLICESSSRSSCICR
jgi:hypothetical protein